LIDALEVAGTGPFCGRKLGGDPRCKAEVSGLVRESESRPYVACTDRSLRQKRGENRLACLRLLLTAEPVSAHVRDGSFAFALAREPKLRRIAGELHVVRAPRGILRGEEIPGAAFAQRLEPFVAETLRER
jgi:hypothetical protein